MGDLLVALVLGLKGDPGTHALAIEGTLGQAAAEGPESSLADAELVDFLD